MFRWNNAVNGSLAKLSSSFTTINLSIELKSIIEGKRLGIVSLEFGTDEVKRNSVTFFHLLRYIRRSI